MKVNCEECGIEFKINSSRLKNKSHACSRECRGKLNSKAYSTKIEVPCENCGKKVYYKQQQFKNVLYKSCSRQCAGKLKSKYNKGNNNPNSLNLTDIEKFFYNKCKDCKYRAKVKKLKFNIDYKYLLDIYNKQQGKCFYSGLAMKIKGNKDYNTLSIDRVDSSKGYVKGNVVFCLNSINMLKSNHDLKDIENVFKAIMVKKGSGMIVKTKLLYEDSKMPYRDSDRNAGYDLYVHSIEDKGNYLKIGTGVAIQPDLGYYFELAPRSSTYKKGLTLYNNLGIIDNNYTGEIFAILYKTSDYSKSPKIGDRLVQILPRKQHQVVFEKVEELEDTDRNDGGFGSSGN